MQKITITLESYMDDESFPGSIVSTSYQQEDLICDDLFWMWLVRSFDTLGLPTISEELKK